MKHRLMQGVVAAAIAVTALSVVGPASARPAPGVQSFGGHVASCAREMGFDGAHNPGMHRGAAGWDGSACRG